MIKNMSLVGFIKQECCNFVSNECLGVDGWGKRFRNQGICSILENEPCIYFANCVLPIAKTKGYGDVIASYQKIDIDSKLIKFKTRKCECGTELKPRQRLCEKCSKKKRYDTYKKQNLKRYG